MRQKRAFWEHIFTLLEKEFNKPYNTWEKADFNAFIVRLFDFANPQVYDDRTAKGKLGNSAVTIPTYETLFRIFKGESLANIYNRNLLAQYFGYESYSDCCGKILIKSEARKIKSPSVYEGLIAKFSKHGRFVAHSIEILGNLYPLLEESDEKRCFDFCSYSEDEYGIDFAFIIIDPQTEDVNKHEIRKLKNRIGSIGQIGMPIGVLCIYYNGLLNAKDKDSIVHSIEHLVSEELLGDYELMNAEQFLYRSINNIDIELRDKLLANNNKYRREYRVRMEQSFYFDGVPFSSGSKEKLMTSPIKFITSDLSGKLTKLSDLEYIASSDHGSEAVSETQAYSFFVISEFGFGKTSLLLQLSETLISQGIVPLYLPLAQIPESVFKHKNDFYNAILKSLFSDRPLYEDELSAADGVTTFYDELTYLAIHNLISRKGNFVLLIDGIDEHYLSYSDKGIKSILDRFFGLDVPIVYSVRKEFWDDRQGSVSANLRGRRFDTIYLSEWDGVTLSGYMKSYMKPLNKGSLAHKRLRLFCEQIDSSEYLSLYGDIPMRPIFLNMIISDIASNSYAKKNLSQMYKSYLYDKFSLDIDRAFTGNKYLPGIRSLGGKFDRSKVLDKMVSVLISISTRMVVSNGEGKAVLLSEISESHLEQLSGDIDTTEILLNSVLIPINKREYGVPFKVKFAHKSYQEYFTSLSLLNEIMNTKESSKCDSGIVGYEYERTIIDFSMGIIMDLKQSGSDDYANLVSKKNELLHLLEVSQNVNSYLSYILNNVPTP